MCMPMCGETFSAVREKIQSSPIQSAASPHFSGLQNLLQPLSEAEWEQLGLETPV